MREQFGELYSEHKDAVFTYLLHMVRDRQAAEDLTQDTFARALAAADRFEPTARPKTWLFSIARNLAINYYRDSARDRRTDGGRLVETASGAAEVSWRLEREESAGAVSNAVGRLGDAQREVFLLKVVEGLTYAEIAALTGSPLGTVQSRFHYAVREVRRMLSRKGVM